LFCFPGSTFDIRYVDDRAVLDKIDVGILIRDDNGFGNGTVIHRRDPDIGQSVNLVDALNAVVILIEIKHRIRGRAVDPASDFFYRNAVRIRKVVPPLADARCLGDACDRDQNKHQGGKGLLHRCHEIKIKLNKRRLTILINSDFPFLLWKKSA
jgi:hypothetical protein